MTHRLSESDVLSMLSAEQREKYQKLNRRGARRAGGEEEGIVVTLPYPPSVNTYWRHPNKGKLAGRSLISQEGREYRAAVAARLLGRCTTMRGRLAVSILLSPPDARRRDLDNALKAVLDALAHAEVYEDDSQIDELSVRRGEITNGGFASVHIRLTESGFADAEEAA